MQRFVQAMPARGRTSWRAMGLLFAGLLQAGFVWALVVGLDIKDLKLHVTPPFDLVLSHEKVRPTPPPPAPREAMPDRVFAPPPPFDIAPPEGGSGLTVDSRPVPPQTGPADHGPVGLAATHTIPPYPPLQARLSNQGTVVLRLLIGADGTVADARILHSSGTEALDRAAQEWVIAHWRYQPAIHGGVAVQSAVNVTVKFDLR